jgi:CHAT domain-containing protein
LQPAQLAALIPDRRTALIDYFVLGGELAIFVIRRGDKPDVPVIHAVTAPFPPSAQEQVRAFHKTIAERGLGYRAQARQLFGLILAPAMAQLSGADRWILSPSSLLWDLPFQALIEPAGKHVLETHSIVYAPSLSSLWALRQRAAHPEAFALALLTLANPAKTGLAPIPSAESESRAIARIYGPTRSMVLTGAAAAIPAFRENAAKASVIHLATHAESDSQHPLDSFLALTPGGGGDGALTARDILALRLGAGLVVLSACETARGEITQGEGMLGLGWAFEAAGAASAVLSQWKVDSAATRDLMVDFHRRLIAAGGAGKAEALRQASLATMRTPGRAHPFYWAPFILTGDGR